MVFTDGTTYESISKVIAKPTPQQKTIITGCNGGDSINITGIPFNASAYGRGTESATGTAYVFYSNANCATRTVTKPVVFLDGFDPTNSRDVQQIYDDYVNKEILVGNQSVKLGDKLRAEGYDIIVYNYEDGGDLIEKNSLAVVKLLEELYTRYGATMQQDFVVNGPSMGALVAQYALAYAESNNIPHHTRLYISFDGPHQGANAPLGLQYTIDYLFQQGISSAVFKKMRDGLHRVPSAKQMITHHSDTNSETVMPDNFRNIFLANLNNVNKYPSQLRKIAVINGSSNLTPNQYIQPSGEMLYVQVKRAGLLGLINGKLGDRLRLDVSAGANNSRVKTTDIWLFSPLLNLFLWRGPQYTKYVEPAGNGFGYDASVGSYFGDPIEPDGKSEAWINLGQTILYLFGGNKSTFRHNINPTFMPTTSAMDLQVPYFTLGYDFSNENIVCTGKTPFDRVYAPTSNQPHVQITAENAVWFENEIKGITSPQPGGVGTSSLTITGPNQFCTTATYTIPNLPTGATVTWSATGQLSVSGSNIGSTVNVSKTNDGKGNLIATIVTACGNYNVNKNDILIGSPLPVIGGEWADNSGIHPIDSGQVFFTSSQRVYVTLYNNAYTQYIWSNFYWNGNVSWYHATNSSGIVLDFNSPVNYGNYVGTVVKGINDCGSSESNLFFYYEGPSYYNYTVFPNPANTQFTIQTGQHQEILNYKAANNNSNMEASKIIASTNKQVKSSKISAILYDQDMKSIANSISNSEKITFDTSSIPNGTYYLHITRNGKTDKRQIVIKH